MEKIEKKKIIAEYLMNKSYKTLDNMPFDHMIELCTKMEDVIRIYNKDEEILKDSILKRVIEWNKTRVAEAQGDISTSLNHLGLDFTFFDDECDDCGSDFCESECE